MNRYEERIKKERLEMNQDTGMGSFGIPYEYVIKQKRTTMILLTRAILVLCYALWTAILVATAIFVRPLTGVIAIVLPLSLLLFIYLTWRRTYVEYEYSIFGGVMTVCRIFGKKTRREMVSVTLREVSAVIPYDDAHLQLIQAFGAEKKLYAVSSLEAPVLYVVLWKDEDERKYLLCMEPTEKAIKLMRYHNNSAFRQ